MKYAFILGTSAFITPERVIKYETGNGSSEFIRINSIYHDVAKTANQPVLSIDATIHDLDGTEIKIHGNQGTAEHTYIIKTSKDTVQVYRQNGSLLFEVHQMDDRTANGLEHYITAELEVHAPIAVIRIRGDFMLGNIHVSAENEKLFVGSAAYATAAQVSHGELTFTPAGVVL